MIFPQLDLRQFMRHITLALCLETYAAISE